MKYSLFIGRWQPFHDGHKKLIQTVLDEDKNVCIAVRDTPISEKNPYTAAERVAMIERAFPKDVCTVDGCESDMSHDAPCHHLRDVKVIVIPDIEDVVYGRDVGWGIREIRLDEHTEAISGTKIRAGTL